MVGIRCGYIFIHSGEGAKHLKVVSINPLNDQFFKKYFRGTRAMCQERVVKYFYTPAAKK